jgi:hypothetical protein
VVRTGSAVGGDAHARATISCADFQEDCGVSNGGHGYGTELGRRVHGEPRRMKLVMEI